MMVKQRWFLLPILLAWTVFYLGPIVFLAERSFHQRNFLGGFQPEYGLDGWSAILEGSTYVVLGRTVWLAFGCALLCVLLAIPSALLLRKIRPAFRGWWILVFWLPLFMNSLLFCYGYLLLLSREGFLNQLLQNWGWVSEPLSLLFTGFSVFIGVFCTFFGYCFFPIYAGVVRMESRWLRVAGDLGASPWQTFRWVVLPLLRPNLIAGAALVFVPVLGELLVPMLLGGGKVVTYASFIQLQFTSYANWPLGAALSVSLIAAGVGLQFAAFTLMKERGGI